MAIIDHTNDVAIGSQKEDDVKVRRIGIIRYSRRVMVMEAGQADAKAD